MNDGYKLQKWWAQQGEPADACADSELGQVPTGWPECLFAVDCTFTGYRLQEALTGIGASRNLCLKYW